ncbi:MAG: glycosyltransferase family 39 protein [Candidatus Sumerlaeota bacterium]|nr:glycosyltransferase family 39 protein [Candidatus Sumerlaeota bacterium]
MLAALAVVSVGTRLALLRVNCAEYTDGILQLTLFSRGNPYWPPLYSALAVLTGKAVGDPTLGGRLVSAVVGGLAVAPIAALGARMGGQRAGAWAGVLFLVAPEALRWGIRVMTDATFLTLFAASLWALAVCRDGERGGFDGFDRLTAGRLTAGAGRLVLATALAVLATLTRYQGAILFVPIAWELIQAFRQKRPWAAPLLAQALWLAVPLWVARGGFAHLQQIAHRTGADIGLSGRETALAYWNLAECYYLLFPYSLTPPIFLCFLAGVFAPGMAGRNGDRHAFPDDPGGAGSRASAGKASQSPFLPSMARVDRRGWLFVMFCVIGLAILAAQAAFGIFEFRYLLPLLAFVLPYAGIGLDRLDRAMAQWRTVALFVGW